MTGNNLKDCCEHYLTHHKSLTSTSPTDDFQAMTDWCIENNIEHDSYGSGGLINDFETKVAKLLGFPAGKFCITGVVSQIVALRLACDMKNNKRVLTHPTSHFILHENQNVQLYNWFKLLPVGCQYRPLLASSLEEHPDPVAAVIYELLLREIGGQLPSWQELENIKRWAKQNNVHLHMDGARLWEACAGFGKSPAQVCQGFDSVYVSFYKGIGALAGAMLLGSDEFIKRAKVDMQRQGALLSRHTPYVVSAAMQFEQRLQAMPEYFQRTQELYQILQQHPLLTANPAQAHCNMLHLYMPVSAAKAELIRDEIASEHKIWLFNKAKDAALPEQSYFECYVGDNLLNMTNEDLLRGLQALSQKLAL